MKSSLITAQILSLLLLFSAEIASACKMTRDPKSSFFFSYTSNFAGTFQDGLKQDQPTPAIIDQCKDESGKFLMIGLAPKTPNFYSELGIISYDGKITDDKCSIKNSILSSATSYNERKTNLASSHKLLRQCTYLEVTDLDGKVIDYPQTQPACKITVTAKNQIRADGDFCFLKIRPDYRLMVGVGLRQECAKRDFLQKNGITLADVEAQLAAYVAGDASGRSTDLNQIGRNNVRIAINHGEELGPITEDKGPNRPRWPSTWSSEVHFGNLKIRKMQQDKTMIDLSLLVDNRGPLRCVEGLCTSPANYNAAIAAEVTLQEVLPNGKRSYVDSWYFGGVATSRWQGFLKGLTRYIEYADFAPGKRYELILNMGDPREDYELFRSGLPQYLVNLRDMNGTAGSDSFRSFDQLASITGLPQLATLPKLSGGDVAEQFASAIASLQNFDQESDWPPYFERLCNPSQSKCIRPGERKYATQIISQFELGNVSETKEYQIKNLTVTRDSALFGNTTTQLTEQPSVECK